MRSRRRARMTKPIGFVGFVVVVVAVGHVVVVSGKPRHFDSRAKFYLVDSSRDISYNRRGSPSALAV